VWGTGTPKDRDEVNRLVVTSMIRLGKKTMNLCVCDIEERERGVGVGDQRKSQLHHFTIGFQKPGICTDSWFLESNGKMVQLGFSLIKNRAPHGAGLVPTGLYLLLPVMRINLQVLSGSGGMIVLWLNRVYLETRELNPRGSIFDQRKSQLWCNWDFL
jgi:hypothetical protein